jgi:hypothetical protein
MCKGSAVAKTTIYEMPKEQPELVDDYRQRNPECELRIRMKRLGWRSELWKGWPVDAADVHHICHAGGRWDRWSNLISLSRPAHEWCHANGPLGKVLCLLHKALKRELNHDEMRPVIGGSLNDYVGRLTVEGKGHDAKDQLLNHLSKNHESGPEGEFCETWKWYGYPPPIREYRMPGLDGEEFRYDLAWPMQKLAVEIHGGTYTGGRHVRGRGFAVDRKKMNSAQLQGWMVLEVPSEQVAKKQINKTIEMVWAALQERVNAKVV